MNYEIITDSASNLTEDLLRQYRIRMISYISEVDGEILRCYEPGEDDVVKGRSFYNALRGGAVSHTSLINISRFEDIFGRFLKKGRDILFVSISGGLTGTIQSARIAAEELLEEYPERRIICIDSLSASLGEGLMVMKLSRLRSAGATLDEAAAWYERHKLRMNHVFTVDDLKYLKRGGRISATTAAIGNLLQVKPILKADDEGKIVLDAKVRSRRRALDTLVDITEERIVDPAKQIIGIAHCDVPMEAEYVAERLKKELQPEDVILRYYDLCTGSHVGPGTIAVFFLGENRMGEARALMAG